MIGNLQRRRDCAILFIIRRQTDVCKRRDGDEREHKIVLARCFLRDYLGDEQT